MAMGNWAFTRVQTLAESGIQTVPSEYVRQVEKALVQEADDPRLLVPVIDLQRFSLLPSDHLRKDQYDIISTQISSAAENWGFFQIINHGIPDSLIARVQAAGKAFFQLPIEEKEAYANEAQNPIGYGSKVGYSPDGEVKLEWGDYYYNIMWPPARRDMSKWPKQLSDFTEAMDEYSRELSKLFECLMEVLSRDLGLETENSLNESVGGEGKELQLRINYYPPCPQPYLVVGVAAHSDPNAITILLPDQIPGLQIRKDGAWIDVQFVPGALVVNIGDQFESGCKRRWTLCHKCRGGVTKKETYWLDKKMNSYMPQQRGLKYNLRKEKSWTSDMAMSNQSSQRSTDRQGQR